MQMQAAGRPSARAGAGRCFSEPPHPSTKGATCRARHKPRSPQQQQVATATGNRDARGGGGSRSVLVLAPWGLEGLLRP
jgi:hypothetical protein